MSEPDREDPMLMDLVAKIDEGQPVDWDTAEREASSEDERAMVEALKVVASVSEVLRSREEPLDASAETEADAAGADPVRWGPLTILGVIGRGAFGTVFRARDGLEREVALKLLSLNRRLSPDDATRLLREGRLMARVKQQNVVMVHGVHQIDGVVGVWMEYIKGRTLEEEIATRGRFSASEAVSIGRDICRALAAVHAEGLLHRDVKAHNVMREAGGRIVLMDFGAGQDVRSQEASHLATLAGTPLYLAPELFEGRSSTASSDIYSLGVLLYHLVSATYPVHGESRAEIERQHREGGRTRLRDARADLPDAFVQLVERATASDPLERYRTAGELEEALSRIDVGSTPMPGPVAPRSATDYSGPSPPSGARRRNWMALTAASVGAVALVALLFAQRLPIGSRLVEVAGAGGVTPLAKASAPTPAVADNGYSIKAGFYKVVAEREIPLAAGDAIAPGERIGLHVETSVPAHVYVVNRDEGREAYLLFPLPGQELANPLRPGVVHQLPGRQANRDVHWQVTSAGGREHFFVYVSPSRLTEFESMLLALPEAKMGRPVTSARVPDSLVGRLRGVGGLVENQPGVGQAAPLFDTPARPLGAEMEWTKGLWVRRMTLANPGK